MFLICLAAVLFFWVHPSREPSYKGKTLSQWVDLISTVDEDDLLVMGDPEHWWARGHFSEAGRAIRAMDTDAVPHLKRMLTPNESGFRKRVRKLLDLQPIASLRLEPPRDRRIAACLAAEVLGPQAGDLAPLIVPLHTNENTCKQAARTLAALGGAGEHWLVQGYSNPNHRVRRSVVWATGYYTNRSEAVFALALEALSSSDWNLEAGWTLGRLRMHPKTVVPLLVRKLEHEDEEMGRGIWIDAIGQFGPQAASALPVLQTYISSTNERVSAAAAASIQRISAAGVND